jgi:hypothetical protein
VTAHFDSSSRDRGQATFCLISSFHQLGSARLQFSRPPLSHLGTPPVGVNEVDYAKTPFLPNGAIVDLSMNTLIALRLFIVGLAMVLSLAGQLVKGVVGTSLNFGTKKSQAMEYSRGLHYLNRFFNRSITTLQHNLLAYRFEYRQDFFW